MSADEPTSGATQTVRLSSDSKGRGRVSVDGHDISRGVRGVTVRIAAGTIPQVEVDLALLDVDCEVDGEVIIPEPAREVLLALGWTAPEVSDVR